MKFALLILTLFFFVSIQSQEALKIKVKKDEKLVIIDSAKFDYKDFALTNSYLGFENRFQTIDHFTLNYSSKKRSRKILIKGNDIPTSIKNKILKIRSRKIILEFSNIVLIGDTTKKDVKYSSPDFIYVIRKKVSFTRSVAWFQIPWPIPYYYIINK